jgi:hypothetical protein
MNSTRFSITKILNKIKFISAIRKFYGIENCSLKHAIFYTNCLPLILNINNCSKFRSNKDIDSLFKDIVEYYWIDDSIEDGCLSEDDKKFLSAKKWLNNQTQETKDMIDILIKNLSRGPNAN